MRTTRASAWAISTATAISDQDIVGGKLLPEGEPVPGASSVT
jgi:hypothetical protein